MNAVIVLELRPTYSIALELEGGEGTLSINTNRDAIALDLVPAVAGGRLPRGGTTGQLAAKASDDDFDIEYIDPPSAGEWGQITGDITDQADLVQFVADQIAELAPGTDLSYTASPTGGTVVSDTGNDASVPLATNTNAGLMAPGEHQRLAGMQDGATANQTDAYLLGRAHHTGTQTALTISDFDAAADARVAAAAGVSVASLVAGKVPSGQLPSYVDDVIEAADFASLPGTGETGKIYVTLDTNREYRWSGSTYIELVASPGSTDAVPEGSTNLYFTAARVLATLLTGLSIPAASTIAATDTVLQAFGKLQAQINAHLSDTNNPHNVTTTQIGAVPTSRTINGYDLTANRTLAASDVGAVPTTRTINGYDLSANRTLTASDVGAIATTALSTDATLGGGSPSDSLVASQKAVKTYADQLIASADAMVYKGAIDCSANPNYPAADAGWTYRVSVAGKIGGASGTNVEAGDLLMCTQDSTASGTQAAVGAYWTIAQTNLDGAVIGPASATNLRLAVFSGTSGKLIADGGVLVADLVQITRTINARALSSNVTLIPTDLTRITAVADATSFTPNADTTDIVTQANTQAAGTLTSVNATGTPLNEQLLEIRLTCTNQQTLAFGTAYVGTNDLPLPLQTTGGSKVDRMRFRYSTAASKWVLVGRSFGGS